MYTCYRANPHRQRGEGGPIFYDLSRRNHWGPLLRPAASFETFAQMRRIPTVEVPPSPCRRRWLAGTAARSLLAGSAANPRRGERRARLRFARQVSPCGGPSKAYPTARVKTVAGRPRRCISRATSSSSSSTLVSLLWHHQAFCATRLLYRPVFPAEPLLRTLGIPDAHCVDTVKAVAPVPTVPSKGVLT
jgi:hypothetical protein